MTRRTLRRLGIAVAALVLLALLAGLWLAYAPREVPPGQPPLATLDAASLAGFREAFNACPGEVRLLALLSPT